MRCNALGLMHAGGTLGDPLTGAEHEELLWYLEEYPVWPYEENVGRARAVEDLLVGVGKRLYQAVFRKEAAASSSPGGSNRVPSGAGQDASSARRPGC